MHLQVSAHAAGKVMDGELVVINLRTGLYYASSGAGSRIWQLLEYGLDGRGIAERIAQECNVPFDPVFADVTAFLNKLVAEDLLEETGACAPVLGADVPAASSAAGAYAPPGLMTFDDMEQAFALDPPLSV